MDVEQFILGFIGLIQGLYFFPFIFGGADAILTSFSKTKDLEQLHHSKFVVHLIGIIFFCFVYFALGNIFIDYFSDSENRSEHVNIWGRLMFIGLILFLLLGVAEGEIKKKKGTKKRDATNFPNK